MNGIGNLSQLGSQFRHNVILGDDGVDGVDEFFGRRTRNDRGGLALLLFSEYLLRTAAAAATFVIGVRSGIFCVLCIC